MPKYTGDGLFKHTEAQIVNRAQVQHACVHTYEMNWTLGSSMPVLIPGPECENTCETHSLGDMPKHAKLCSHNPNEVAFGQKCAQILAQVRSVKTS